MHAHCTLEDDTFRLGLRLLLLVLMSIVCAVPLYPAHLSFRICTLATCQFPIGHHDSCRSRYFCRLCRHAVVLRTICLATSCLFGAFLPVCCTTNGPAQLETHTSSTPLRRAQAPPQVVARPIICQRSCALLLRPDSRTTSRPRNSSQRELVQALRST